MYLKGSSLPAELRARLDRALALRRALDAANDELDPLRRRRAELIDRAAELRESVRTIERTPQAGKLRQTLLDRLAEAARQSEEIGAKITQRVEDVAMARAEFDDTHRDRAGVTGCEAPVRRRARQIATVGREGDLAVVDVDVACAAAAPLEELLDRIAGLDIPEANAALLVGGGEASIVGEEGERPPPGGRNWTPIGPVTLNPPHARGSRTHEDVTKSAASNLDTHREALLTHLAIDQHVSASTRNQALASVASKVSRRWEAVLDRREDSALAL
ncbi:hypothetical protein WMF39_10510 [Sorangium sp. So ce1504]